MLEVLSEESSEINESDMLFLNHPDAPDYLELSKQNEQKDVVCFPMYNDSDLKFLDQNTDIGR